jgi:DNA-binding transcriptional LysR family regulator
MRGATLRQLKAFSLVARHHSFGRAAAELHLTPSAVSLQIKDLEQCVGLPLFGRHGRSTTLTPAGEALLPDINRALLALRDADEIVNRLRGRETGVVTVGMISNSNYFLPRLLARFHAMHPGIELRVTVGNRDQVLRHLVNDEVDFAIMGQPPKELEANCDPFAPHPLGIIAAPEHRLAHETGIPAAELGTQSFVVREPGSGTRAAMDRFFSDARIAPYQVMELTSNESIKQAVIGNMGLAFLSLHTAGLELQSGVLCSLDVVGLPVIRSWHVVRMKTATLSDASDSLRRFIIEFGGAVIERQFGGIELCMSERHSAGTASTSGKTDTADSAQAADAAGAWP